MSAKTIAQEYMKRIHFISKITYSGGVFFITSKEGKKLILHQTSIQTVRHHLTNYSSVCRTLIDTEKNHHSDVFLDNIISKFRELVNDLVFRSCIKLFMDLHHDNLSNRIS